MKKATKASSFFCKLLCALLLCSNGFLLVGCADVKLPPSWTGEPDDSVINAPRVVGRPPSLNQTTWPNLGDVPEKPNNFVPQSEWRDVERSLKSDKIDAQINKTRIEADAPTFDPPSLSAQ